MTQPAGRAAVGAREWLTAAEPYRFRGTNGSVEGVGTVAKDLARHAARLHDGTHVEVWTASSGAHVLLLVRQLLLS